MMIISVFLHRPHSGGSQDLQQAVAVGHAVTVAARSIDHFIALQLEWFARTGEREKKKHFYVYVKYVRACIAIDVYYV